MTKFHELPDSIECDKMKEYFEEYLSYYCNNTNSANVDHALSELLELADRQAVFLFIHIHINESPLHA